MAAALEVRPLQPGLSNSQFTRTLASFSGPGTVALAVRSSPFDWLPAHGAVFDPELASCEVANFLSWLQAPLSKKKRGKKKGLPCLSTCRQPPAPEGGVFLLPGCETSVGLGLVSPDVYEYLPCPSIEYSTNREFPFATSSTGHRTSHWIEVPNELPGHSSFL